METKHLAALAAFLAAVESCLILSSILPPMASYSPMTIIFMLSRLLVIGWCGWLYARRGLKEAARSGAVVAASGMIVLVIAAAIGRFLGIPVLGIQAADIQSLFIILALTSAINIPLGAIIAAAAAFISLGLAPKERKGKPAK